MSDREPTSTPLEETTEAAIACLGAWLYPSDPKIRQVAVMACANIDVAYYDAVARLMEATDNTGQKPLPADEARYQVAMAAVSAIGDMRFSNEVRHGIAASGLPIDDEDTEHD